MFLGEIIPCRLHAAGIVAGTVTFRLESYYSSVDESKGSLSDSAKALIQNQDMPGFFDACGLYYDTLAECTFDFGAEHDNYHGRYRATEIADGLTEATGTGTPAGQVMSAVSAAGSGSGVAFCAQVSVAVTAAA